jgi:hypothetical protein
MQEKLQNYVLYTWYQLVREVSTLYAVHSVKCTDMKQLKFEVMVSLHKILCESILLSVDPERQ